MSARSVFRNLLACAAGGLLVLGLSAPASSQDLKVAYVAGAAQATAREASRETAKDAAQAGAIAAAKSAAKAAAKSAARQAARTAAKQAAQLVSREAAQTAIRVAQKEAVATAPAGGTGAGFSSSGFTFFSRPLDMTLLQFVTGVADGSAGASVALPASQ